MTELQEIFTAVSAEGPFGFKPDRDSTINAHFSRFAELDDAQRTKLLSVRDGESQQCVIEFPDEMILVEYSPAGYFDPTKQRQWGYTVRRVRTAPPVEASPEAPSSKSGIFPALSPKNANEPKPRPASGIFQGIGSSASTSPLTPTGSPASDATHEAELRLIRMEKGEALARSKQFEDEVSFLKDKLGRIEQEQIEAQREHSRFQAELTQLEKEKQKLSADLRKARTDLATQSPVATQTPVVNPIPAQRNSWEAASVDDEIQKRQQREMELQRQQLKDEKARLAQLEEKLQRREAKLARANSADASTMPAPTKQAGSEGSEIWVPVARSPRKIEPAHVQDERGAFIRVCIIWFVALVLLGQCISLAFKSTFPSQNQTTPSNSPP